MRPDAVLAVKFSALLVELAVAKAVKLLLLTLTWLAATGRLAGVKSCSLKFAVMLLPLFSEVRLSASFVCKLSTEAESPDVAEFVVGTNATSPLPLPPTVRLLALRLSEDAATLPSVLA